LNYLLSAQILLDLCAEEPNAAQRWGSAIDSDSLRISVISRAHAMAEIARIEEADVRGTVESVFAELISRILADAGEPGLIAFEKNHAEQWRGLMFDRRLASINQIDRQIYATALAEGLAVVEGRHEMTDNLRTLGLQVVVPGE